MPVVPADWSVTRRLGSPSLWFAVLGGPLAWTAHLLVSYGLVYVECPTEVPLLIYLVTALAVLTTLAAGFLGWRAWRQPEPESPPATERARERTAFLGLTGLILSAVFLVVILAQGAAPVALDGCGPP